LGIVSISQQQARVITGSRMQQNDSMPSGIMNVGAANVTSTSSSNVAIANATPNQPRNVTTTHASTNIAWLSATIV
jgi:hypothetical protein